jgi:hypothetical protein
MNASSVLLSTPVMFQGSNFVRNHFRILCVSTGFCSWLNYGVLCFQKVLLYQFLSTLGRVFISLPMKLLLYSSS